jgi:hypothetical protein
MPAVEICALTPPLVLYAMLVLGLGSAVVDAALQLCNTARHAAAHALVVSCSDHWEGDYHVGFTGVGSHHGPSCTGSCCCQCPGQVEDSYTGVCKMSELSCCQCPGQVEDSYIGVCKMSELSCCQCPGQVEDSYTGVCKMSELSCCQCPGQVEDSYTGVCKMSELSC